MKSSYNCADGKALFPFLIFILSFLGPGILFNDFYSIPAPIAVIPGIITAFFILKGPYNTKFTTLIRGCGNEKILTMCLIYLLAGGFAGVTKAMGGVDATVNLGLTLIPLKFLPLGIFLLAAFLSTATGTSVGAIVAMGPIVVGLADQSSSSLPLLLASLLTGAMFGDNLSVISDTTIAATQTQQVEMKDKFRVNLFIAGPAAIFTIALLLIYGYYQAVSQTPDLNLSSISYIPIMPYLLVLGLAIAGINVFAVLTLGIVVAGLIGLFNGQFSFPDFCNNIYLGFTGMSEIFLLSMLTGGLAAMVTKGGGINYLLKKISKTICNSRSAQMGIACLVSVTNFAIANNTVAIIITGPIAKEISQTHNINKRKTAALIDIFSCLAQGILPYGAQILILLSFTEGKVSYPQLLPYVWYLYLLLFFSFIAIFTPFIDRIINKQFR